jgi:ribosomal protein S18 acetylase RimI-like enzyme
VTTKQPLATEVRRLCPEIEESVRLFFEALQSAGDNKHFHPHPFDDENAHRLSHYGGKDLYYLVTDGVESFAYGMLRGWDEGYEIPSLGIAVHPHKRGMKVGRMLMEFLHVAARARGCKEIMLKVYKNNTSAVKLYESLGYVLESLNEQEYRGRVKL